MTTTETTTPTLKVGDVMYSSWGYDQTNVDFYKVVRATAKSVWLISIGASAVEGSEGFMCNRVLPDPARELCTRCNREASDRCHSPEGDYDGRRHDYENTPHVHRIRNGYQGQPAVTLTSYSSARLWNPERDETGVYCSWYA